MAGQGGAYPKPDNEKVTRVPPAFTWTELPGWRVWQPATVAWWAELWAKPQATMWDQSGASLHALAALYDDLFAARTEASRVSAEIRAHEDRHGLNPKSMLQLRWRFAGAPSQEPVRKPPRKRGAGRTAALRVVERA